MMCIFHLRGLVYSQLKVEFSAAVEQFCQMLLLMASALWVAPLPLQ